MKRWWLKYSRSLKYVIAIVVFGVYFVFLSEYNLVTRLKLGNQISRMESEKEAFQSTIARERQLQQALQTDNETLETFAREQFFMKKENEDVFIVK